MTQTFRSVIWSGDETMQATRGIEAELNFDAAFRGMLDCFRDSIAL